MCIDSIVYRQHYTWKEWKKAKWARRAMLLARLSDVLEGKRSWRAKEPHGIMPHSNSLLAMGAATWLMNAVRICGSFRRIPIARCSISAFCPVGGILSLTFLPHEWGRWYC